MKAVADYIHDKGLKFGMYSCAGTHTCAGYPGSFEHEFEDAKQFADFGVDYLKYDFCFKPRHMSGELLYKRMNLALRNCGRPILFSACNWGEDNVHNWIRESGAHMYRSTPDIQDNWESIQKIALSQIEKKRSPVPSATMTWTCWWLVCTVAVTMILSVPSVAVPIRSTKPTLLSGL